MEKWRTLSAKGAVDPFWAELMESAKGAVDPFCAELVERRLLDSSPFS